MALSSFTAMSFTWVCQCKNVSVFTPRYFIEFDENLNKIVNRDMKQPLSGKFNFGFIRKYFFGSLKITSSVFSTWSQILLSLNQLFNCLISCFSFYLDFSSLIFMKEMHGQQSNALYSVKLPYEDH